MIKIWIFCLLFIVFSCTKKTNENLEQLEKLNSAANFLMLVSDDEKLITNNCHITSTEALKLIQPLHALIDEQKQKISINDNDLSEDSCQKTCQCGLYSDLSKSSEKIELFLKLHNQKGKKALIECANQSAKWLCNSPLLVRLKSNIEQNNNAL